jgi:hypothetical protein
MDCVLIDALLQNLFFWYGMYARGSTFILEIT